MTSLLPYVAVGLFVGAMVGFTGVGGGSLMTPILVLGFGQSPALAVGTDLLFAATTKLAATTLFGYNGSVDWRIVARLAAGSVPAAAVAIAWFQTTSRTQPVVDDVILHGLAVMLLISAAGLLLQSRLQRLGSRFSAVALGHAERYKPALTVLTGAFLGAAVTFTSVGAGALGVVVLLYLYPQRLTPVRLIATDIAHALPLTLVAGLGHAILGHVNLPVLGCLLLGSIPGVLIAVRTTIRLSPTISRVLVAIMLLAAGTRLLLSWIW